MSNRLVLIDGHALAYRMYFALERTGMKGPDGTPTWAVYGFFNTLFAMLRQVQPSHLAVTFDAGAHTFRNDMYPAYKANRAEMPDTMRIQLPQFYAGVQALGIPIFQQPGYEADDVIGTLVQKAVAQHMPVSILTGDQDSFQLIDQAGQVSVLIPSRGPQKGVDALMPYSWQAVFDKWGVWPNQVIDFKALKGDTSDNIPGVPGIGDKTAALLLSQHHTLQGIYEALEKTPMRVGSEKLQQKLLTYQEQAWLSYRLATIDCAVPLETPFALEACALRYPVTFSQKPDFVAFCQHWGFRSFLTQELSAPVGLAVTTEEAPLLNLQQVETLPELTATAPHSVLETAEALNAWLQAMPPQSVLAVDIETTGLDAKTHQWCGVALAYCRQASLTSGHFTYEAPLEGHGSQTVQALQKNSSAPDLEPDLETVYVHFSSAAQQVACLALLKPYLEDAATLKLCHNAKFERQWFAQAGIALNGLVFDTMLASYVHQPEARHGLKALAQNLLGLPMTDLQALLGKGAKATTFDTLPLEQAAAYAAKDAYATYQLAYYFVTKIFARQPEKLALLYGLELPLEAVLAKMEATGIGLDLAYLTQLQRQLAENLDILAHDIYATVGLPFNLNSPKQVGDILFNRLGLSPGKKTAGKTAYSTSAEVLESMVDLHPMVPKLLEYRQLFKLQSTYVEALPLLVHPKTQRIHTHFNQTVTATGRLSSSDPNLQNIPIRSAWGQKIRAAFVPHTGWGLLSADYSQIELRLLAHYSQDEAMIAAFASGLDIHAQTAALVFGVPLNEVTKDMRYRAKTVNFGVVYGQSAHSLGIQLGIPRAEAQGFIDQYFATYPRVKACIEGIKAEAHRTGKATTLFGRQRELSADLASKNRSVREFAERAAFNTPLQGSAADLVKLAMIEVSKALHVGGYQARLLLQVHDELVLEAPPEEQAAITTLVQQAMALGQPLRVPLVIDCHWGDSWLET